MLTRVQGVKQNKEGGVVTKIEGVEVKKKGGGGKRKKWMIGVKRKKKREERSTFFVATLGGSFSSLLIPRCVLNEPYGMLVSPVIVMGIKSHLISTLFMSIELNERYGYPIYPLTPISANLACIDFTLSNTRRFYSSIGNPSGVKGLRPCLLKMLQRCRDF